jgi:two-component sensor histidine kinase
LQRKNTFVAEFSFYLISSIALVHEKLYRSEGFTNADFTQDIRDLTIYLFDS